MEFHIDNRSTGTQKFDHLVDKIRRCVIFFEDVDEEFSMLMRSLRDLRTERVQLATEIAMLNRQCETITTENDITNERATVLMERLDDFLGSR